MKLSIIFLSMFLGLFVLTPLAFGQGSERGEDIGRSAEGSTSAKVLTAGCDGGYCKTPDCTKFGYGKDCATNFDDFSSPSHIKTLDEITRDAAKGNAKPAK